MNIISVLLTISLCADAKKTGPKAGLFIVRSETKPHR